MDAQPIIDWLTHLSQTHSWAIWTLVGTQVLGLLSVTASAIITLTPGKSDDQWLINVKNHSVWGKVWKTLESLSVIKKK